MLINFLFSTQYVFHLCCEQRQWIWMKSTGNPIKKKVHKSKEESVGKLWFLIAENADVHLAVHFCTFLAIYIWWWMKRVPCWKPMWAKRASNDKNTFAYILRGEIIIREENCSSWVQKLQSADVHFAVLFVLFLAISWKKSLCLCGDKNLSTYC